MPEPEPENPQQLLTDWLVGAQYQMSEFMGSDMARFPLMWVQHLSGVRGTHLQVEQYGMQSPFLDTSWHTYYMELVQRFELITLYAREYEAPYFEGISHVMRAFALGMATDAWGSLPNKEAFKYFGYGSTPVYDTQDSIYIYILSTLEEAQDLLQEPDPGQYVPGPQSDIYYQGNAARWLRAARLLSLRFSLRLAHREQNYAPLLEMVQAGGLFNDANDDMFFPYLAYADINNPWYNFDYSVGNTRVGAKIVELLKAVDDPRLPRLIRLNLGNEYMGAAPGSANFEASRTSNTNGGIAQPGSRLTLLSFAEQKFIEAEVYFRNNMHAEAAAAYNQAVIASLDMYSARNATWEALYATKEQVSLEDIIHGKYVALFLNPEVWTDWRRTGLPQLSPASSNQNDDLIPRRFLYPNSEVMGNASHVPQDVSINSRLWWDIE